MSDAIPGWKTPAPSNVVPIVTPPKIDVREVHLTSLADVKAQPITWLLPRTIGQRIPKKAMTIVGGKPGTGKSQFTIALAAELTREGVPVLFVGAEDGLEDTVRPRLLAAAGDPRHFYALGVKIGAREDTVLVPDDVPLIDEALRRTGAALLIVDPVAGHISPEINGNSDQSLRRALIPLGKITRDRGVATVLVMHQRKNSEGSPLDSLNGGTAFGGVARSVLLFGRHKDDEDEDIVGWNGSPRYLCHVKCNGARLAPALRVTIRDKVDNFDGEMRVPSSYVAIVPGEEDAAIRPLDLR